MNSEKSFYEHLFLSMDSGVIVRDSNGKILKINPSGERILGLSSKEILEEDPKLRDLIFYDENGSALQKNNFSGNVDLRAISSVRNSCICFKSPGIRNKKWLKTTSVLNLGENTTGSDYSITMFEDITGQREKEVNLKKKLNFLINPSEDYDNLKFEDLFDIEKIQVLQDEFSQSLGVASIITLPDGTPITNPSNFTHLCSKIIRKTEIGLKNCYKSDSTIGKHCVDGPTVSNCKSCGLIDAGAGITVGNVHIANWLIGQIRVDESSEEDIKKYAVKIGSDVNETVDAFRKVPVMTRSRFHKCADLLFTLSSHLSEIAFKNLQQAKTITKLNSSEKNLRKLGIAIRQSPISIIITDLNGSIEYVNEKFCKVTGYRKEEVFGQNPRIFKSGDMDQSQYKEMWDTLSSGNEWAGTFCNKKKNGDLYWEDAIISPVFDENGSITNYIATKEDITEKKARQKINTMLLSAVEQSDDSVEILDTDKRIIYVNPSFSRRTGYIESDIIGKRPSEIFSDGTPENDKKDIELWETVKTGVSWRGRFTNKKKDGTFIIEDVSISPVFNSEGKIDNYVAVKKDITDFINLIEEQNNIKEHLYQAQKLESVGQLSSGIAHDFNNILSGIMSASQLLLSPSRNIDEKAKKYAEMIYSSCERAADLTSKLLNYSLQNRNSFKYSDIEQIVNETAEILQHTINKGIGISMINNLENNILYCDESSLQNALLNLSINASHAISGSGSIELKMSEKNLDSEYCTGSPYEITPGNYCLLEVSDSGSGIAEENLDKIFNAFFTTKPDGKGTGLGLSSVKRIIEEHSGAIEVESKIGMGTSFTLLLPFQ